MTHRRPPRLALALLERLVPDSEPLAGDLQEQFQARPSALWLWLQVLAAIATAAWPARSTDIRPLRLVDLQPADAVERTRRFGLRFASVNLTASPVTGVGGLGLVILAAVVTWSRPAAWWAVAVAALAGCGLGFVRILVHDQAGGVHTEPPAHVVGPSST